MDKSLYSKNIPTVFIIFGATGDLMGKKIIPALFHLYVQGKLPKLFKIIGFSRREWTNEQFKEYVTEIVHSIRGKEKKEDIEAFLNLILYQQGDFQGAESYKTLASSLGIIDGSWNVCSNKLFYLAVPPQYYKTIFENLASSGLTIPCGPEEGWTRVLVEKPFGHDLQTARDLDMLLANLFKEEQIYRIDHYLAKEMLQNILSFRFSNNLFEGMWNKDHIGKIEIRLLENIDIEGRGTFYDGLGALRDVGQNHLLQMLALVTMSQPSDLDSEEVRKNRADILDSLQVPTSEEVKLHTFRAQYKGYRETKGVSPTSNTETYFRVLTHLNHPLWEGVPIILEGGKNLTNKKEIVITFKHPTSCLCPDDQKTHYKNRIIFSIGPKEEISIEFWAKKPGLTFEMQKQTLTYLYRDARRKEQYIEEYEKLLLDCILGNQLLFVSTQEVSAMWKFIDPIICNWEENQVPLAIYEPHRKKILHEAEKIEYSPKPDLFFRKQVGIVGLGKMGGNIARRLHAKKWHVVAYNRSIESVQSFEKEGGKGAYTLTELIEHLPKPRIVILSLPAGKPTEDMLFSEEGLLSLLDKGDYVIDAANAYYVDTINNYKKMEEKGIHFVDVGVSGGPGGALQGACLMVGGKKENFNFLSPLLFDMATHQGVQFFEGEGAGHFVKMVHNGIEYGMMQAIAEGFEILKKSSFKLDLTRVVDIYNHGSVIESRLLDWLGKAFYLYGTELKDVSSTVLHSGEGEWTVTTAEKQGVKAKVIEEALKFRKESANNPTYAGKVLTALRNMFGGHSTK